MSSRSNDFNPPAGRGHLNERNTLAQRNWNSPVRTRAFHVLGLAILFCAVSVAFAYWKRPYSAEVRLLAYERTFGTQAEAADFAASVTATQAFAKLVADLPRGIFTNDLADRCQVSVLEGQPLIRANVTASNLKEARTLADAFARHVAACADQWVSRRTKEVDRQVASVQRHLRDLRKQFADFDDALLASDVQSLRQALAKDASEKAAAVSTLKTQISAVNTEEKKTIAALAIDKPALRGLQQELEQALARYTDEHPKVKELRASIIALQKETVPKTSLKSTASKTNALLAELNGRRGALRDKLKKAESSDAKSRQTLQKFATNEVEFTRLQTEYTALGKRRDELIQSRVLVGNKGVEKWRRADAIAISRVTDSATLRNHGGAGALTGACAGLLTASIVRHRRKTVRTRAALQSATGLPILTSLPELETLDHSAREYWALETLELLRNTAGVDRRGSFVCGFIAADEGEGCSTWMELLAKAGMRNGNRVLMLSRPDADTMLQASFSSDGQESALFSPEPRVSTEPTALARYSLVANAAHVRFQKQWERAFASWRDEEDALILVELPPATTSDALVLSPAIPNVLWITAANTTEASKVAACVGALKNTGCNLIGAGLNRASAAVHAGVAAVIFFISLLLSSPAAAQEQAQVSNSASTNAVPSAAKPLLAPWQERLTVGPGDVLDISLYGQADSGRPGILIAPDGRISYLQAKDVEISGLTIDEVRTKLESILTKFHLAPRVVIIPTAFHSKKYFMLGNVAAPGAFVLDRPITILEAVARAKGFVSGGPARSSFELADLNLAFLVRRQPTGEFDREPINFEKLFLRGAIEENKHVAPDDYLYFPPVAAPEVYVVGEAAGVGPVAYSKELTVLGAIASRGGFTDAAFRQKILVIRGSLDDPETFVIDSAKALRAASLDFLLQPRDIIYVSRKPWAKAEEILKGASSDFVRAMVVTWTGRQIQPILR